MELVELLLKAIDDKKGENVARMHFQQTHPIMDEMIVCDVSNPRLMHAVIESLEETCDENGYYEHKIEGKNSEDWVLFYCDHIVVSVFIKEAREFYNVERLWKEFIVE